MLGTPLILKIDSGDNDYSLQWRGIVKIGVKPDREEIIFIQYNIFFLKESFIHWMQSRKKDRKKNNKERTNHQRTENEKLK